ncbi:MAG: DUF1015 domain-containing protein [Clostridia bacterium]|nr:DUF1015 domain-containing protein [Clostridia bacterium]
MNFDRGFSPADILLPARPADPARWAVIACDQYTSQRDYWDRAEAFVGDAPSALNLIQPEIDLDKAPERLPFIRECMRRYLSEGILKQQVGNGFVLTLRKTASGLRPGLIGKIDLEQYDFTPGNVKPIRASEGTILERIPPRMQIRQGAPLETPHIMLLADDPEGCLVEAVYEKVKDNTPLYDFELMLGGGRISGWAVEDGALLWQIDRALDALQADGKGLLLAVGDGNHSLATAKACWEKLKPTLSERERLTHPARYALAEVVNLHCEALLFHPIHRVVFGAQAAGLRQSFSDWLAGKNLSLAPGADIEFLGEGSFSIGGAGDVLPTVHVQAWLDEYLKWHPEAGVDYVHGEEAVKSVCAEKGASGILLGTIDKSALFPTIRYSGVLPRKSFSIGVADEKRFYLEARRIL